MKRPAQDVYLEEDREPVLVFHEGELARYQHEMQVFVLPSDSRTLLQCAQHLSRFIDTLSQRVYQQRQRHDADDRFAFLDDDAEGDMAVEKRPSEQDVVVVKCLPTKLLGWYRDVCTRADGSENKLYRVNRLHYWMAYARAFRLAVYECEATHRLYTESTTSQFAFCTAVAARFNIVVSNKSLGAYSLNDLRDSVRLVCAALYTFPYNEAMKRYVHALFYRYVSLVACDQSHAPEDVFDNPLFCNVAADDEEENGEVDDAAAATEKTSETLAGLLEAFEEMSICVDARAGNAINNRFIFDGEKLFAPHMYRLHLSARLSRCDALRLQYRTVPRKQIVLRCLDAWRDFTLAVAEDKRLRSEVITRFTQQHLDIHMYHGERERFREKFPFASDNNRQVLVEMRPNVLREITETQALAIRTIVTTYYDQVRALILEEDTLTHIDAATFGAPRYELECLLLARVTLHEWYACEGLERHADLRDALVYEELENLDRLDEMVRQATTPTQTSESKRPKGTNRGRKAEMRAVRLQQAAPFPLCVKLMRRYYVIERGTGRVFVTQLFIEALFVWQALCLCAGLLTRNLLHGKTLRAMDAVTALLTPTTMNGGSTIY